MMRLLVRLAADPAGAAAAEMAMVTPLLILLMFGTFELGHFFLSEHVVQKSVRDAARYAARLPLTKFPSCGDPSGEDLEKIQRVARTGHPDEGGAPQRLQGWTANGMTTVTVTPDTSGIYEGIYTDFPCPSGVPIVTVSASVPYPTLFGALGLGGPTLQLNAQSQTALFGA